MNTKNAFSTLLTVLITAVIVGVLTGVITYSYAASKKDLEIEDLREQLSKIKEEAEVEPRSMGLDTSETQTKEETTETPSTATTDETADWKTYKNSEIDFTFKYPGDWFIYGDKGQQRIYIQTQEGEVSKATIQGNFKRVWISYSQGESSIIKETETKNIINSRVSTIISGNLKITLYEYDENDPKMPVAKAYWTDGTSRYSATIAIETGTEAREIETLKQILSTFQFTK